MKKDILEIVKKISAWCFEHNSKTFTCDFEFSAHVNWIEVEIISGGYDTPRDSLKIKDGYLQTNKEWSLKEASEFFEDMILFKKEHDEWFSDENLAKQEEIKKQDRIIRIKSELQKLETPNSN